METTSYRLDHDGIELRVEVWLDGKHNHARLLANGVEAAAGHTDEAGRVDLAPEGGPHVRVQFWWKGRVWRVVLVDKSGLKPVLTSFEPPPGTRAARSHAFQQRHPGLYSARHIAFNLGGTIVAILGISAVVRAFFGSLLPKIDVGFELPEFDPPAWLKWLDPFHYLKPVADWVAGWLPDLSFLGEWLGGVAPWAKYIVGFLIACAVAAEEYKRRKKHAATDTPSDTRAPSAQEGEARGKAASADDQS